MKKAKNHCENNKNTLFNIAKNKGITLVALVVSIIILLILSVVSVNMLIGENGIITEAKESRVLTILSDIIFNIESGIVEQNIDRISKGKQSLSSSEMLNNLGAQGFLGGIRSTTEDGVYYLLNPKSGIFGIQIEDERLNNLDITANGDIWLDNYKRGKIKLSPNINTIYSYDGNTKITVIDGTAEQINSQRFRLHALDREDFICWINQYGEIISEFPDTTINVVVPREEEYTAIYGYGFYEQFRLNKKVYMETNITKENGWAWIEMSSRHLLGQLYVEGIFDSTEIIQTQDIEGFKIYSFQMYYSPNSEDLTNENLQKLFNDQIDEQKSGAVKTEIMSEDERFLTLADIDNVENYSQLVSKYSVIDGKEYPVIHKKDMKNFAVNEVTYGSVSIDKLKEVFEEKGFENVDRIYYRGSIVYYDVYLRDTTDKNNPFEWYYYPKRVKSLQFEPVVKFIDV